jgi:hypothetical protein
MIDRDHTPSRERPVRLRLTVPYPDAQSMRTWNDCTVHSPRRLDCDGTKKQGMSPILATTSVPRLSRAAAANVRESGSQPSSQLIAMPLGAFGDR